MQLSKEKTLMFIRSLNGKMFSAEFVKKDGSVRRMVARMGVTKGVKGTGTYSHTKDITRANITVFDMGIREFRAIPINRLMTLKTGGAVYEVV